VVVGFIRNLTELKAHVHLLEWSCYGWGWYPLAAPSRGRCVCSHLIRTHVPSA